MRACRCCTTCRTLRASAEIDGCLCDQSDNLGEAALDVMTGGVDIGIGGGLAIDTATGDLAVQNGGVGFDLGGGFDL